MKIKSYDPGCHDLAAKFLPHDIPESRIAELASHIQESIEDFLGPVPTPKLRDYSPGCEALATRSLPPGSSQDQIRLVASATQGWINSLIEESIKKFEVQNG